MAGAQRWPDSFWPFEALCLSPISAQSLSPATPSYTFIFSATTHNWIPKTQFIQPN